MQMRIPLCVGTASVLLGIASAASAQDPGQVASEACWRSVVSEARGRMAAQGIFQSSNPRLSQESNAETRVSGTGTADNRPFSYGCTYNIRNGQTYGISVSPSGGYDPGYRPDTGHRPESGWNNQGYNPGYNPGYQPGWQGGGWNGNYVPRWAVGRFYGYNAQQRANVMLDIRPDGTVYANVDGRMTRATVRDGVLRQGLFRYYVRQTRDGLMTIQKNNQSNVVYYRRTR